MNSQNDVGKQTINLQDLLDEKEKIQKNLNDIENVIILERKAWKKSLKMPLLIAIPSFCITGILRETSYVAVPAFIATLSGAWFMWRFSDARKYNHNRDKFNLRKILFDIYNKLDTLGALSESEQIELRSRHAKLRKNKKWWLWYLAVWLFLVSSGALLATVLIYRKEDFVSFISLSITIFPAILGLLCILRIRKINRS